MSAELAVKNLRIALGLTQIEFAKVLKLTKTAISYYETGAREPKRAVIKAMRKLAVKNNIPFNSDDFLN